MRTTPESFAALVAPVAAELRERWPWLRVRVDHDDHAGAVRLAVRPGVFGIAYTLRRKHLQALALNETELSALIRYALMHEVGRGQGMPECCLNKLPPWPANVRCP